MTLIISRLMPKVNSSLIEKTNILPVMNIGNRIRLERKKRKWSQERLAREVDLTQGLISQIENGTNVSSKHLMAIARALDVSADWLETGKGEQRRLQTNGPMALHYPPVIEDAVAVVPDPDGSELVLIVFRDAHGAQVTLKLTDKASRSLSSKLLARGK